MDSHLIPHNKKESKETYKWFKDQREHVLLRPDTYVGAINVTDIESYAFQTQEDGTTVCKTVTCTASPALFKMYDEINNHVDEDDYKNNCPPEWPLHLNMKGTYEDEGFCESYYG